MTKYRDDIIKYYIKNYDYIKYKKLDNCKEKPVICDYKPYIIIQPGSEHNRLNNEDLSEYTDFLDDDAIILTVIEDNQKSIEIHKQNYDSQKLYFITEIALNFISRIDLKIRDFITDDKIIDPPTIKKQIKNKSSRKDPKIVKNIDLEDFNGDNEDIVINYTSSEKNINDILKKYYSWGSVKEPSTIPDYISIYVKDSKSVEYLCSVKDVISAKKFASNHNTDFTDYKWYSKDKIFYKFDDIYKINNGPKYQNRKDIKSISGALAGHVYTDLGKLKSSDNVSNFLDLDCNLNSYLEVEDGNDVNNISLFIQFLYKNYIISKDTKDTIENNKDIINNRNPIVLSTSLGVKKEIAEYICWRTQTNSKFYKYIFWDKLSKSTNNINYNHYENEIQFKSSKMQFYKDFIYFLLDLNIINRNMSPIKTLDDKLIYKYEENKWVVNNNIINKYSVKNILNSIIKEYNLVDKIQDKHIQQKLKPIKYEMNYILDTYNVDPTHHILKNLLSENYNKFIDSIYEPKKFIQKNTKNDIDIDPDIGTEELMNELKYMYYHIGVPKSKNEIIKFNSVSFNIYKDKLGNFTNIKNIIKRYFEINSKTKYSKFYVGNLINNKGILNDNVKKPNYKLLDMEVIFDTIIHRNNVDKISNISDVYLGDIQYVHNKYNVEFDDNNIIIPNYIKKHSKQLLMYLIKKECNENKLENVLKILKTYEYVSEDDNLINEKYRYKKEENPLSYIVDNIYDQSNIVRKGDILNILDISSVYGEFSLQEISFDKIEYESKKVNLTIDIGNMYKIYRNNQQIESFDKLDECIYKFKDLLISESCVNEIQNCDNFSINDNFEVYESNNKYISYVIKYRGEIYNIIDFTDKGKIKLNNLISHIDKRRCIFLINKNTEIKDQAKIFINNTNYYELSWPTNIEESIKENIKNR